jgi:hypothetical protein
VRQEKDNEQDAPRDCQIFQELGLLHAFLLLMKTLNRTSYKDTFFVAVMERFPGTTSLVTSAER